jgi:hypothetical protein
VRDLDERIGDGGDERVHRIGGLPERGATSDGVGATAAEVEASSERLPRLGEQVHPLEVSIESVLVGAEKGRLSVNPPLAVVEY